MYPKFFKFVVVIFVILELMKDTDKLAKGQCDADAKDWFDADSIRVLEWNEHIRKRPKMYIEQLGDGSDPKDGIYTLLKGVLALVLDECPAEVGKEISIEVREDCASIRDFGRWIPFDQIVPTTSGVPVGMGAKEVVIQDVKVANALSADFYVASYRNGECSWTQYSKGALLDSGTEQTTETDGTCIKFVPDSDIFPGYAFREEFVKEVLQNIAHQNKGLSISLNGAVVPDSF